jgi:flagellar basal body L-ring protein FlgH
MKKIASITIVLAGLSMLSSCSNYIKQMHREFDRSDGVVAPEKKQNFDLYRKRKAITSRPMINSQNNPYVVPSIKRQYSNPEVKQRVKARDIADNRGDGSLWSGVEGRDNYLFTKNNKKSHGDIILIKIAGKMKNEITAELKRAFPSPMGPKNSDKKPAEGEKAGPAPAAANAGDQDVDTSSDKIYDRVSSVVVEEINQDHLLLRGRKSVLYKNRKRMIEIQALVSRKDVLDDDTVVSDTVIENNITVLR